MPVSVNCPVNKTNSQTKNLIFPSLHAILLTGNRLFLFVFNNGTVFLNSSRPTVHFLSLGAYNVYFYAIVRVNNQLLLVITNKY